MTYNQARQDTQKWAWAALWLRLASGEYVGAGSARRRARAAAGLQVYEGSAEDYGGPVICEHCGAEIVGADD